MTQYYLTEFTSLWGYDGPLALLFMEFVMVEVSKVFQQPKFQSVCHNLPNLYRKLWGNGELLNFLIFVAINYCELKPFLEMVL